MNRNRNLSRALSILIHGWTLLKRRLRHRLSSDPQYVRKSKNPSKVATRKNTAMWSRLHPKRTSLVYHCSNHWKRGARRPVLTHLVEIWAQLKLLMSLSSKWNSYSKKISNSPKRWSLCRTNWLRASMEAVQVCSLLEASVPSAACHKILTPWLGPSRCQTRSIAWRSGAPSLTNTQMLITLTKWEQNNLLNLSLILIEATKTESHRRKTTKIWEDLIIISYNLQVEIWLC